MIRGRRGRPAASSNPHEALKISATPQRDCVAPYVEGKEPAGKLLKRTSYQDEALAETGETNKIIITKKKRSRSIRAACIDKRDKYSPVVGAYNLLALSMSPSSQEFADTVDKYMPWKKRTTTYTKEEEGDNQNEVKEKKATLKLTEKDEVDAQSTKTKASKLTKKEEVEAQGTETKAMKLTEKEEVKPQGTETKAKKTKQTYKKKKQGGKTKSNKMKQGSRCSRVNGRGWRCNQTTLVGYSLCQHHLGMARSRTMSSLAAGGIDNSNTRVIETRGNTKNNINNNRS